jgi:hypothetical protein
MAMVPKCKKPGDMPGFLLPGRTTMAQMTHRAQHVISAGCALAVW